MGLVLILCLAAGCSREARRDRHLKKAETFYAAKDYRKAVIEYINALRLDSGSAVCLNRLGSLYQEQGQINRALPLLVKAHAITPKDRALMSQLLRIYRDLRENTKAREMALRILAEDPAHEEALIALADTATTPEDQADLASRVEKLRGQGGDRTIFHVVAGMQSARRKEWDTAEAAFQQAVALNSNSLPSRLILQAFYLMRGRLEEADRELQQAIQLAPQDLSLKMRQAEFKLMTSAPQEARSLLESITKTSPDFVPAWSLLAAVAFDDRRFEDASNLVVRVLSERGEDFQAHLVNAKLSLVRTNFDQAIKELQQLRKLYDRAPQVPFELARAYLATNGVAEAANALDAALALNPNYAEALFLKGQLDLRRGEYSAAITELGRLTKIRPAFPAAQLGLASAYQASGNWEEALRVYGQLATIFPTNPQPVYLRGLVYRQQKRNLEAEQAFAKTIAMDSTFLPAQGQLLELNIERKDFSAGQKLVDGIMERNPKEVQAWLLQARLHLAQGNTNQAETALLKCIQLDANSLAAYQGLASLYVNSGRPAEAIANLDELLAKSPNNLSALLRKAYTLAAMSNYVGAAESYESILRLMPDHERAVNNLAYLYSETLNRLDRAYELAARGHQLWPNDPELTDTLGWILYRRGDYDRAAALLTDTAAKLSEHPEAQFHLGMANYMRGDIRAAELSLRRALALSEAFPGAEEARQRLALLGSNTNESGLQSIADLQKLLHAQPKDPVVLMRLADLQAAQGAANDARASYERLLELTPKSASALIRLAALHAGKLGDPAKAMELAKQARQLPPNDFAVARQFGQIAFQAGQHEWAASVLQECAQKPAPPSDLLYDFAVALYSIGKVGEAQNQMRQAVRLDPNFEKATLANQFLTLTEGAASLTVATQQLAAAQAALKADPDCVPALMIVGEGDAQAGRINEARRSFERILERFPQFTPALRSLVLLPEGKSDEKTAYELNLKARRALPRDPLVALAAGRALFKRGDFAAAKLPLREAVEALKENADAAYYHGMALYKLGDKKQALGWLSRAKELGLHAELEGEVVKLLLESGFSNQSKLSTESSELKTDSPLPGLPP